MIGYDFVVIGALFAAFLLFAARICIKLRGKTRDSRFLNRSLINKWMRMTKDQRRLSDIAYKQGNLKRKEKLILRIRDEYKKVQKKHRKN